MFNLQSLLSAVAAKSTIKGRDAAVAKFEKNLNEFLGTVDLSDIEENEFSLSEAIQAPERTGYGMYIPLGYLIDALSDCNDQHPVDVQLVRNLFDKAEYGVFALGNLKQDIEVAYEADNIADEDSDEHQAGDIINPSELYIKGGRHRTAFLMTLLELKGIEAESDTGRNQLIRVRPSSIESVVELAQVQMLSNTTRSMGTAEKSLGRLARKDIDVDDTVALFTAAYETSKASEKTDVYRTLFSRVIRNETKTLGALTPNTLSEIGSSFLTTVKKNAGATHKHLLAFSKKNTLPTVLEYHETIYQAAVVGLTDILETTDCTNIARNAKAIGAQLAQLLTTSGVVK